ncbi:hypothetical protein MKZ38_010124 [Zalerion maritima]|uniref:F-box domain-containing protein n=1 Tax=Zalerion maritima TaxID=339359 RepID=A0AAD5RSN4_9PEZI|nr:hypothetical protein MKZ38_010124 [Zalerion maritima]
MTLKRRAVVFVGRTKRAKIADNPVTSPSASDRLTSLPTELRLLLLENLSDFSTLLSAILTRKSFHELYQGYERRILLAIFRRQCNKLRRYNIGQVFWELVFAIRHDFMKREIVEELFTVGWQVFQQRDLEELLIPLGRALAWSYCLDGRDGDAVDLLTRIWHGRGPFHHTRAIKLHHSTLRAMKFHHNLLGEDFKRMWPKATLIPVFELLKELDGPPDFANDVEFEVFRTGLNEDIYVAGIKDGTLRLLPKRLSALDAFRKVRDGIEFGNGGAMVGLVYPGRIPIASLTHRDDSWVNKHSRYDGRVRVPAIDREWTGRRSGKPVFKLKAMGRTRMSRIGVSGCRWRRRHAEHVPRWKL